MNIKISMIRNAGWNTHADVDKGDEFDGLVNSIRENGLVQAVVVRPVPGGYELIDGHRRLAAIKAAGLDEVRAEVAEVDDVTAMAMTAAANIQRLDNDPILEAELFERMMKRGCSVGEVAAKIGCTVQHVTRRMRLTTLTKNWHKAAEAVPFTVEALENIAAYEPEIQDEVWNEEFAEQGLDEDGYEWDDIEREFTSRMRKLGDCSFDKCDCGSCPFNTANHTFLFPDFEEENARCQKASCYIAKANAAADKVIQEMRVRKESVIEVASKWDVPNYWEASEHKEKKNPQAYVYIQAGIKSILWSKKPAKTGKEAMTEEEKKAEKEKRKAEKARQRLLSDAYAKIATRVKGDDFEQKLDVVVRRPAFAEWAKKDMLTFASKDSRYWLNGLIKKSGGVDGFIEIFGDDILTDEQKVEVGKELES